MSHTVIAFLHARDGGLAALRDFEAPVLPILDDHGGRLVCAVAPDGGTFDPRPDEVHLLSFPELEAFVAYRADPRHAGLAEVRARAIGRTGVLTGITVDYG